MKSFKEKYRQITEVGSGTYGKVYKVQSLEEENKLFAFKKITHTKDNEGFPQTALREIKILQALDHENVIKLHQILTSKPSENNNYKGSTFLVFDYLEHDLWGLMKKGIQYNVAQLKCLMKQLLEGVDYIHSKKIIHRDLKSANILVSNRGNVKIADFGLARNLNSLSGHYTSCVVTLWYRSPELLLGQKKYTTQIDIWSIGCIMAELILGKPIFPGDKENKECELIFNVCGTPNEENWPGVKSLPLYSAFISSDPMTHQQRNLKEYLVKQRPFLDTPTLDFIDKLLTLNPEKRPTAREALNHPYFTQDPKPCDPIDLPKITEECHITLMSQEKKRKEQKKKPDDDYLQKRRYNEMDSSRKSFGGRDIPPPPERQQSNPYGRQSPKNQEPSTFMSRHSSYYENNKPPSRQPPPPGHGQIPLHIEKKSEPTFEKSSTTAFTSLLASMSSSNEKTKLQRDNPDTDNSIINQLVRNTGAGGHKKGNDKKGNKKLHVE